MSIQSVVFRWFDYKSRVNRKTFFIHYMFWIFILSLLSAFLDSDAEELVLLIAIPLFFLISFAVIQIVLLSIRRLHDFDCSGKWLLAFPTLWALAVLFSPFVPLTILLLWAPFLILLITPGTHGSNRYGVAASEVEGSDAP